MGEMIENKLFTRKEELLAYLMQEHSHWCPNEPFSFTDLDGIEVCMVAGDLLDVVNECFERINGIPKTPIVPELYKITYEGSYDGFMEEYLAGERNIEEKDL